MNVQAKPYLNPVLGVSYIGLGLRWIGGRCLFVCLGHVFVLLG